jgi:hypothetical protein
MNRRTQIMIALFAAVTTSVVLVAQPPARPVPARGATVESAGTVAGTVTATGAPAVTPVVNAAKDTARQGMPTQITIQREVFNYERSGRRDPYKSLMSSSDVRPLLSDLRLTAVAFDPDGNNSVAILRDSYSKQQYRIRVGQQLGRLRVAAIHQKTVQFSIEEFGFNRQETLAMASDTTKVRTP